METNGISLNGDIFENINNYKEKYVDIADKKKFDEFLSYENMCSYLEIAENVSSFRYRGFMGNDIYENIEVFIAKVPKTEENKVMLIFRKI